MMEARKERMELIIESRSQNESFARAVATAFLTRVDPTLEEMEDIKTAISEAVSNSILHGYEGREGNIILTMELEGSQVMVQVRDHGIGIEDIEQARTPLFTSKPSGDRSGMGFYFMEAFMEEVIVESEPGKGTLVTMKKMIGRR